LLHIMSIVVDRKLNLSQMEKEQYEQNPLAWIILLWRLHTYYNCLMAELLLAI